MAGIPESLSPNTVPLPAHLKKRKSGDGGSGYDWWEILTVLAQSEYARRVGIEQALSQYLEARSSADVKEAFRQVVDSHLWSGLLHPTRKSKINAIISRFI